MKKLRITILLFALLGLAGCELIGDIFQAGVGVGIFIVIAVIALVLFLFGKVFRK